MRNSAHPPVLTSRTLKVLVLCLGTAAGAAAGDTRPSAGRDQGPGLPTTAPAVPLEHVGRVDGDEFSRDTPFTGDGRAFLTRNGDAVRV